MQLTASHVDRPQDGIPITQNLGYRLRPVAQRREFGFELLHLPCQSGAEVAELLEGLQLGLLFVDAILKLGSMRAAGEIGCPQAGRGPDVRRKRSIWVCHLVNAPSAFLFRQN